MDDRAATRAAALVSGRLDRLAVRAGHAAGRLRGLSTATWSGPAAEAAAGDLAALPRDLDRVALACSEAAASLTAYRLALTDAHAMLDRAQLLRGAGRLDAADRADAAATEVVETAARRLAARLHAATDAAPRHHWWQDVVGLARRLVDDVADAADAVEGAARTAARAVSQAIP